MPPSKKSLPAIISLKSNHYQHQPGALISDNLKTTLHYMVGNLVDALSCVGAVVMTLEANNSLVIRAYSLNIPAKLIEFIRKKHKKNLLNPYQLILKLTSKSTAENLASQVIQGENGKPDKFRRSRHLYDLCRPVLSKSQTQQMQDLAEIKEVLAVPLLLADEVVGVIFAASSTGFSVQDLQILTAFGYQAATAIDTERRLQEIQAVERVILSLQNSMTDETQTLQIIVDAMVDTLGYAGAMVATLEADNSLPVRTYRVDVGEDVLDMLQRRAGVTLVGPKAKVYVDNPKFKDNLSIRAVKGNNGKPEKFVVSDRLYDLLRPIANEYIADLAQHILQIKQVIAVPFFLEDEVVGNIFVATRRPRFTDRDKDLLAMFGQQAAVGIRNARLYQKAEERQHIAQMFGKMAFSATAYIHALRNHIGAFHAYMRLIDLTSHMPMEQRAEILDSSSNITNQLNQAADILDNLHEPWRQKPDAPTNVNKCLNWATRKVFSRIAIDLEQRTIDTQDGIIIHRDLTEELLYVKTAPDMLIEAFRVLIKNAVEAIKEKSHSGNLWLKTVLISETNLEVSIQDDGAGMKPETMSHIFEMGWSSRKGQGMGFGLFWTKDYIEGLGGSIRVESTWNKGTRFTVKLPISTDLTMGR